MLNIIQEREKRHELFVPFFKIMEKRNNNPGLRFFHLKQRLYLKFIYLGIKYPRYENRNSKYENPRVTDFI